jgi:hypothetical protein
VDPKANSDLAFLLLRARSVPLYFGPSALRPKYSRQKKAGWFPESSRQCDGVQLHWIQLWIIITTEKEIKK